MKKEISTFIKLIYTSIIILSALLIVLPVPVLASGGDLNHLTNTSNSPILQNGASRNGDKSDSFTDRPVKIGVLIDDSHHAANAGKLVTKQRRLQIADLVEFFDRSVKQGELVGLGNTPVASDGKLRAFKNLITTAGILIDIGDIAGACEQLKSAHKKSVGQTDNNGYVTGPAAPKLSQMIKSLKKNLGCKSGNCTLSFSTPIYSKSTL